MFDSSLLSRFMQEPSQVHFGAAKRVLRYLQGIMDYGIRNLNLIGYSDSDWAGSINDMKSTSSYAFLFGSSIFSWLSKKKSVVAQSLPKQNMFQHPRLLLKLFGVEEYLKTLVKNKIKGLFCIVITNQQLQFPRIQSAMKDQSIFLSSIILS